MGQGGYICEYALREAGDVIAMERPAENRGSCDPCGSKVGSKGHGQLGCTHPMDAGMGDRAGPHRTVTFANAPSAPRSRCISPCSSCSLYPACLSAPHSKQAQGTRGYRQQQRRG